MDWTDIHIRAYDRLRDILAGTEILQVGIVIDDDIAIWIFKVCQEPVIRKCEKGDISEERQSKEDSKSDNCKSFTFFICANSDCPVPKKQ